jgi:hypothetical protein
MRIKINSPESSQGTNFTLNAHFVPCYERLTDLNPAHVADELNDSEEGN